MTVMLHQARYLLKKVRQEFLCTSVRTAHLSHTYEDAYKSASMSSQPACNPPGIIGEECKGVHKDVLLHQGLAVDVLQTGGCVASFSA
jgi:hypothetical protein